MSGHRGLAAVEPGTGLTVEALARALHGWLCGDGVHHGDKGRPFIGWICERGATAILAALAQQDGGEP